MIGAPLALALLLASGPAESSPPYSAVSTSDLDKLAVVLQKRVATVELKIRPQPDLLVDPERLVFGVVLDERTVATVAQLCSDAESAQIRGPQGRVPAKIVLLDLERRVALIRAERPLKTVGLQASSPLPKADRELDADVFALVSTDPGAGVVMGTITELGEAPEYEGHPRTTLALTYGMPVFDAYVRWVGFARTVAWDRDRQMLVPPDKVRLARTSTAAQSPPSAPETPKRPWWAR